MGTEFTRRSFIQAAGTTAGVMIATGFSPFSYAQNEKVRLGVIGTGGQGNIHIRGGLAGTPDIHIVAICDIYEPHQRAGALYAWSSNAKYVDFEGWSRPPSAENKMKGGPTTTEWAEIRKNPKPNVYFEYKEMLEKEQLDAVLIATPLDTHYQITMDCLDADKFVFCEKTMCYTIDMARDVVKKAHEKGKFVQVGHQRRYNPEYNLALKMARDGVIGRINHIDMQWHRNNNWRRPTDQKYFDTDMPQDQKDRILKYSESFEHHMNWRIYKEKSLGLCTELLPHQADVSNWFLGKMPTRIYGMGGLDYWRDGRTVEDNISVVLEYDIKPGDEAFGTVSQRSKYQDPRKINRGYSVRVVYSSIMANQKRGASETIMGDMGAIECTETKGCTLTWEPDGVPKAPPPPPTPEEIAKIEAKAAERAAAAAAGTPLPDEEQGSSAEEQAELVTGGGTQSYGAALEPQRLVAQGLELTAHMYQFRDFARHIKTGGKPRTNEMCGLSTTIISTLAYQAIQENKVIEVDPALMAFDFETPSWTEYGQPTA